MATTTVSLGLFVVLLAYLHTSSGFVTFSNGGCDDKKDTGCYDDTLRFCFYNTKRERVCPPNTFCSCDGSECITGKPCTEPTNLTCSNIGFRFPSYTDCNKYHICSGNSSVATYKLQSCLTGMVFDPKTSICVKAAPNVCFTVTCPVSNKAAATNLPLADPKFYVKCVAGIGEVKKCEDDGYTMQAGKGECEFVCTTEGYFKDSKVCGKYYTCERNGTALKKTEHNCEKDEIFDESLQSCTPGTCNNNNSTSENPPNNGGIQ